MVTKIELTQRYWTVITPLLKSAFSFDKVFHLVDLSGSIRNCIMLYHYHNYEIVRLVVILPG